VSKSSSFFDPLDKPEPAPAQILAAAPDSSGPTGGEVAIRDASASSIPSQYTVQRSPKGPKLPDRITIPVPRPLMKGLYELKQKDGTTYIEEVLEAIAYHLARAGIKVEGDQ
jgi:hypothetical protein